MNRKLEMQFLFTCLLVFVNLVFILNLLIERNVVHVRGLYSRTFYIKQNYGYAGPKQVREENERVLAYFREYGYPNATFSSNFNGYPLGSIYENGSIYSVFSFSIYGVYKYDDINIMAIPFVFAANLLIVLVILEIEDYHKITDSSFLQTSKYATKKWWKITYFGFLFILHFANSNALLTKQDLQFSSINLYISLPETDFTIKSAF